MRGAGLMSSVNEADLQRVRGGAGGAHEWNQGSGAAVVCRRRRNGKCGQALLGASPRCPKPFGNLMAPTECEGCEFGGPWRELALGRLRLHRLLGRSRRMQVPN